jgi:hypothetical protein
MKLPYRQRGMSALSMLIVLLVAIFFGTCVIKLAPVYIESKTIQGAVESVVDYAKKRRSVTNAEIKSKLGKLFQVNMVDILNPKDIKVSRKDGKIIIDARYEKRIDLMFNIDVVVKFDHLIYEFTSAAQ